MEPIARIIHSRDSEDAANRQPQILPTSARSLAVHCSSMLPRLVPEKLLAAKDEALRSIVASLSPPAAINPDDQVYGAAFRRYMLFTHLPSLAGENLTAQEIFYNRFYWFLVFARLHKQQRGPDPRLAQEACQILESAPCRLDWTVIEHIESLVARRLDAQPVATR